MNRASGVIAPVGSNTRSHVVERLSSRDVDSNNTPRLFGPDSLSLRLHSPDYITAGLDSRRHYSGGPDPRSRVPLPQLWRNESRMRRNLRHIAANGVDDRPTHQALRVNAADTVNTAAPESRAETFLQSLLVLPLTDLPEGNLDCPICMEPYSIIQHSERPLRLPCSHVIGKDCLLEWLNSSILNANNNTCPICRTVLLEHDFGLPEDSPERHWAQVQDILGHDDDDGIPDPNDHRLTPSAVRPDQDWTFERPLRAFPNGAMDDTQRDGGLGGSLEPRYQRWPPLREISNQDRTHGRLQQAVARAHPNGAENESPRVEEYRTLERSPRSDVTLGDQIDRYEDVRTQERLYRTSVAPREVYPSSRFPTFIAAPPPGFPYGRYNQTRSDE